MFEPVYEAVSITDEKKQVFVLSAFPEFILDYFREDFWNARKGERL